MQKNIFIIYATILQLITGALLLFIPEQVPVARLGVFYAIFPGIIGPILMTASAFLALFGLLRQFNIKTYYLFFLPQLFFIISSGVSAAVAIINGSYADGVIRPWYFIFIDQLPFLISVLLYLFALVQFREEKA